MPDWLSGLWYGRSCWRWLLWPVSLVYTLIIFLRRQCYLLGLLKSTQLPVPVIVVGNITVGGTGKTPFCIFLCNYLKKQGWQPGLVSRGYGGQSSTWPQTVTTESDPILVGDEPVLLVQRTACPMVVGPDRVAAAKQLLTDSECDIIISDDGLQHYALHRDIEIALIDHQRQLGNGFCLPAGPLREPQSRLSSVNLIIENGRDMSLSPQSLQSVLPTAPDCPAHGLEKCRMVAMAGIGHPERFFQTLRLTGLSFTSIIKPDHHLFSRADIEQIDADVILMTEKDAVKCRSIADKRCYFLPVEATLTEQAIQQLTYMLKGIK